MTHPAASNPTSTSTTAITGVTTVAIPVADQERSLAFYIEALGFEKRRDTPFGPGRRWIEVAPHGATTTIALPPRGEVAPGIDTGIRLATRDAAADHAALRARSVDLGAEILQFGPGVPPMFSLRDPDGNTLYVVGIMPDAAQQESGPSPSQHPTGSRVTPQ